MLQSIFEILISIAMASSIITNVVNAMLYLTLSTILVIDLLIQCIESEIKKHKAWDKIALYYYL